MYVYLHQAEDTLIDFLLKPTYYSGQENRFKFYGQCHKRRMFVISQAQKKLLRQIYTIHLCTIG